METRKYMYPIVGLLFLLFLISGCSWLKGYGKIRLQSGPEKMTVEQLEDNWSEYHVYYAGHYGGLSIKHPSAVMFDPKNDSSRLVTGKWTKVEDKDTLSKLISSIQSQKAMYYPRIWRILGPDDQLYGYLFTALDQVFVKVVDEKTMYVYNLPEPPYLRSYPGAGSTCPGVSGACGS
jgi:hypothetical protein